MLRYKAPNKLTTRLTDPQVVHLSHDGRFSGKPGMSTHLTSQPLITSAFNEVFPSITVNVRPWRVQTVTESPGREPARVYPPDEKQALDTMASHECRASQWLGHTQPWVSVPDSSGMMMTSHISWCSRKKRIPLISEGGTPSLRLMHSVVCFSSQSLTREGGWRRPEGP